MSKFSLIILAGAILFSMAWLTAALAEETTLILKASASAVYNDSPEYSADKAVDGNSATFWAGQMHILPIWIQFDAGRPEKIGQLKFKWYDHELSLPQKYDIQLSQDGANWEDFSTQRQAQPGEEVLEINKSARYIRLYIQEVGLLPLLEEFMAYKQRYLPQAMRFQANLQNSQGEPINGRLNLTFRLYETEAGGEAIWQDTKEQMEIENGMLDVKLERLNLAFDQQYWLGVEIEGDNEMVPRFELTTVPYAFSSEK